MKLLPALAVGAWLAAAFTMTLILSVAEAPGIRHPQLEYIGSLPQAGQVVVVAALGYRVVKVVGPSPSSRHNWRSFHQDRFHLPAKLNWQEGVR